MITAVVTFKCRPGSVASSGKNKSSRSLRVFAMCQVSSANNSSTTITASVEVSTCGKPVRRGRSLLL
jgi:hypothetical protein